MRITIYTRNDCVQCHATKRALLRGVIASGNRNFGEAYGRAGDVIARKCGVPWLYRFELMGTQSDIENVRKGVTEFWQRQPQNA